MNPSMKYLALPAALAVFTLVPSLASAAPPEPYGATPTENQIAWQEMEYYGLIHFSLNTYTGQEWGYGDVDPKIFNPDKLDTDQWARIAKEAGMKGLILVAKHHDGFCLWPTETTDYNISASPWKGGKGDLVADFVASCKKFGIKPGIYISPWDRNHTEYGREGYVKAFHEQWRELMTLYGEDLFELWLDGANGGNGWYGGAKETRRIGQDYYKYDALYAMMERLAPHAVVFEGKQYQHAVRWNGNERGLGAETVWSITDHRRNAYGEGIRGGPDWRPAEADTPLRPKWFYREGAKPRSPREMVDLWFASVGRNNTLNLGLSPDKSGLIPADDEEAMLELRRYFEENFARNLAAAATITAEGTRAGEFGVARLVDGDPHAYWASADGVKSASLTFSFAEPTPLNCISLQEAIRLGQRVERFEVEWLAEDGSWKSACKGTTIGWKRLLRFPTATTSGIRVRLESEAPCLAIGEIGLYSVKVFLEAPEFSRDAAGQVALSTAGAGAGIRYALGENPREDKYQDYSGPFDLSLGGKVRAYAFSGDERSELKEAFLGVSSAGWKITGSNNERTVNGGGAALIDQDPKTLWWSGEKTEMPLWVSVDMGKAMELDAFTYLPRQDGRRGGVVVEYRLETSMDGENWSVATEGEFDNIDYNPVEQVLGFERPITARHLRFTALRVVGRQNMVTACDIGVRGRPVGE